MKQIKLRELINSGKWLHFEYGPMGGYRWHVDGHDVSAKQAKDLIKDLKLVPAGDVLLGDPNRSQTWRTK